MDHSSQPGMVGLHGEPSTLEHSEGIPRRIAPKLLLSHWSNETDECPSKEIRRLLVLKEEHRGILLGNPKDLTNHGFRVFESAEAKLTAHHISGVRRKWDGGNIRNRGIEVNPHEGGPELR